MTDVYGNGNYVMVIHSPNYAYNRIIRYNEKLILPKFLYGRLGVIKYDLSTLFFTVSIKQFQKTVKFI